MSAEFAGQLREYVAVEQRIASRDAIAGAVGNYAPAGAAWAAITPIIPADLTAAGTLSALPRWRVTMRKRETLDLSTRLVWRGRYLAVRGSVFDPRAPGHVVLTCDEVR